MADVSTLTAADEFDAITVFDAIHDQAKPGQVLANIYRPRVVVPVLAPTQYCLRCGCSAAKTTARAGAAVYRLPVAGDVDGIVR